MSDTAPAPATPTTKTAFVLGLKDVPAADVVTRAAAAGIQITRQQVHNLRSAAKKARKRKRTAKPAVKAAPAKKVGAAVTKKSAPAKSAPKKKSASKTVAAPKQAASTKAAPAAPVGSKRAFVEAQPVTMSNGEVVKAAAKAGVKLSANYVYKVRLKSKTSPSAKRGPGRPKGSGAKSKAASAPIAKAPIAAAPTTTTVPSSIDGVLADLVVHHGIDKIRAVLTQVEARVARLLSGK